VGETANGLLEVASWSIAWGYVASFVAVLWLNLYEARTSRFPSRLHRYLLLLICGPLLWFLAMWQFIEPVSSTTGEGE